MADPKPIVDSEAVRRGRFVMDGLFAALGVDARFVGVESEAVLKESGDSLNKDHPVRLVIHASASGMSDPRWL
jgi:hypothetical protein